MCKTAPQTIWSSFTVAQNGIGLEEMKHMQQYHWYLFFIGMLIPVMCLHPPLPLHGPPYGSILCLWLCALSSVSGFLPLIGLGFLHRSKVRDNLSMISTGFIDGTFLDFVTELVLLLIVKKKCWIIKNYIFQLVYKGIRISCIIWSILYR